MTTHEELASLYRVVVTAREIDRVEEELVRQGHAFFQVSGTGHEATALLAQHLPSWTWDPPQGGLCLWVRLPYGTAAEFAQLALRHGVSVVPGPVASADGSFNDYLRLPFGHMPGALEEGVRRLAAAWAAYVPSRESRRQTLEVIV